MQKKGRKQKCNYAKKKITEYRLPESEINEKNAMITERMRVQTEKIRNDRIWRQHFSLMFVFFTFPGPPCLL